MSQELKNLPCDISAELFNSALQAVTDGLFIFDNNRRLIFANPSAEALQSKVMRLRLGSRCCEMLWQTGDNDNCVVDRAVDSGHKLEFEIPANTATDKPILITVQPLKMPDGEGSLGALVLRMTFRNYVSLKLRQSPSNRLWRTSPTDRPMKFTPSIRSVEFRGSINAQK